MTIQLYYCHDVEQSFLPYKESPAVQEAREVPVGQEVRVDREDLVGRADREVQEVQVALVDPGDQKQLLNQEQQQSPQANLEAPVVQEVQEVQVAQEVRVAQGDQADQQPRGQVNVTNNRLNKS